MSRLSEQLKQQFLRGQGIVTQEAGAYNPGLEKFSGGYNTGTDIGVPVGTPISLPQGNYRVEEAYGGSNSGWIGNSANRGYGNSVLVRDQNTGQAFRFSHLLRPLVQAGQTLTGGNIGLSGATGNVTGPHVDIELYGKNSGNAMTGLQSSRQSALPKVDVKALLGRARSKYGKGVIGISNDPKRLMDVAKRTGSKIVRVQL